VRIGTQRRAARRSYPLITGRRSAPPASWSILRSRKIPSSIAMRSPWWLGVLARAAR
jgi:hypothetical protein